MRNNEYNLAINTFYLLIGQTAEVHDPWICYVSLDESQIGVVRHQATNQKTMGSSPTLDIKTAR